MRTRLIRPGFYSDETIAELALGTRYLYIGLWTLCDDAGYFEAKPRQIAASLLPYEGLEERQRLVDEGLAELETAGRIRLLECGRHGLVPTLPRHGAKGGTKAETFMKQHRSGCLSGPVRTLPDKSASDSGWESGHGSVSGPPALAAASLAAGGFAASLAARTQRPGLVVVGARDD